MNSSPFSISVYEKAAFTIRYSDESGTMLFSIEPVTNQQIYLSSRASIDGRMANDEERQSPRYREAVERVVRYLGRNGAKVEIED